MTLNSSWQTSKRPRPDETVLTIRLDSEFEDVLADPSDRNTVNAAAKCLKASVSGPPPATSNSCLSSNIEAYVLPEPLTPLTTNIIHYRAPVRFTTLQGSRRVD